MSDIVFTKQEVDALRTAKVRLLADPTSAVEVDVQGKPMVFRGDDPTALTRLDALIRLAKKSLPKQPRRKSWRVVTKTGY